MSEYHCTQCGERSGSNGRGGDGCEGCWKFTPGYCDSRYVANHEQCSGHASNRPPGSCPCSCHIKVTDEEVTRAREGLARLAQMRNCND